MKDKKIGSYWLGMGYVDLYVYNGKGGHFNTGPESGALPRITIGIDDSLPYILEAILHEAMELTMLQMDTRFYPDSAIVQNCGHYVFHLDHNAFQECCARVSRFMEKCRRDLLRAVKNGAIA
jgi:hypothetical protein